MFHSFLSIQMGSSYKHQIALPLLHEEQHERNVANTSTVSVTKGNRTKTLFAMHLHVQSSCVRATNIQSMAIDASIN